MSDFGGNFATALPKGNKRTSFMPGGSGAVAMATAMPGSNKYTSGTAKSNYVTALPKVVEGVVMKSKFQPSSSLAMAAPPQITNGGIFPSGPPRTQGSPHLPRRCEGASQSSHILHITKTIYNTLWGQGLTFHPYTHGDSVVLFPSLWPDRRATLIDTYQGAELDKHSYELCKLLLATNSYTTLDLLMEEKVLSVDCTLSGGIGRCGHSLAHLACALGLSEVVQCLIRRTSSSHSQVWTAKDENDHTPEEVCFKADLRRVLPFKPIFTTRKRLCHGQPLKDTHKKRIFELATMPNDFYRLILLLQMYVFDVNNERNGDGELLIHVAIRGGLPQLPLVFALVNFFKADVCLRDGNGASPLSLAIEIGEEALVEVCVCVFGMKLNDKSGEDDSSPLHLAVAAKQPRIVNILLRRGADPCPEDKNGCDPLFMSKKLRAYECQQILCQYLKDRTERFCQDTIAGRLDVSKLYSSDLHAVCVNGCTLLMVASAHAQDNIVRQLLKKGDMPLDYKQMKLGDGLYSLSDLQEASRCESHSIKDHTLKTAVHLAAEKGNLTCLRLLLEANAHPSLLDSSGMMPLHHAVDRGHIECVKMILNYPNNYLGLCGLKPALDISTHNGFTEITALLEQARERRQSKLVKPLLFEVAHSGSEEHIIHVLDNGDDVNPLNELQEWPMLVASNAGNFNMVVQLHQFGGHIARQHRQSRSTPLHVAARGGHTKIVRYLLQFCPKSPSLPSKGVVSASLPPPLPTGAMEDDQLDINCKNAVGCTPLELAAAQGHTNIVSLLLSHGASSTLPDSTGRLVSCAAYAGTQFLLESHRKERLHAILSCLRRSCSLSVFRQCWQGSGDFNLRAENGDSILLVAASHAHLEVLHFLLNQAATIKHGTLVSSHSVSDFFLCSDVSSDSSLPDCRSKYLSDSMATPTDLYKDCVTRSLHRHPDKTRRYDELGVEDDPVGRHTAIFNGYARETMHRERRREERLTASGEVVSLRGRLRRRKTSLEMVSSSEEEDPAISYHGYQDVTTPHFVLGIEGQEQADIFTSLVRYVNPHDEQSMLHRASLACRHDIVGLLIELGDSELANLQDKAGNTALHLACSKAIRKTGRRTVQTILKFDCVCTTLRNLKNELPEQLCMKTSIKKLVHKARQSRVEPELSPSVPSLGTLECGQQTLTNICNVRTTVAPPASLLQDIPEISPEPYMSTLTLRLQQMKEERNAQIANGHADISDDPLPAT